MKKTIVLFDMDGTLTPCREKITYPVIASLRKLSDHCKIGIVSGSDMDYIMQQCASLFDIGGISLEDIDILPCNGTKFYKWEKNKFELVHNNDMSKQLSINKKEKYQSLVRKTIELQSRVVQTELSSTTLTGTFLQYRGSMLNWCFVGRDADVDIRNEFVEIDKKYNIRKTYKAELDKFLEDENIAVTTALGGKTSIDIYPHGWDKTFALQYYPGWNVYFVGDACHEGGNDWHIYHALKDLEKNVDTSYQTAGPDHTIDIIDGIIDLL